MTVLAAHNWPTNGDLIADVASLGYLDGWVLDPTYGRGLWWTKFRPPVFSFSDLKTGVDFRSLPYANSMFDAVAFDPPYVCKGGRTTSGIKEMDDRYGLEDAPKTPFELVRLICQGMSECCRVLKPQGYLLVKCMDYISSGRLVGGTVSVQNYAEQALGMETYERFTHVGSAGPQPAGRRQVHARNNASTLFIFRKP
jgi:hypothetical protein